MGGQIKGTGNHSKRATVLVLEPDPGKIRKEGLVNGAGWKCTLWNVRNFISC